MPHQANAAAMGHMRALLKIPAERLVDLFSDCGNQVAASIPTALHHACSSGRLRRGDHALIVGSARPMSSAPSWRIRNCAWLEARRNGDALDCVSVNLLPHFSTPEMVTDI